MASWYFSQWKCLSLSGHLLVNLQGFPLLIYCEQFCKTISVHVLLYMLEDFLYGVNLGHVGIVGCMVFHLPSEPLPLLHSASISVDCTSEFPFLSAFCWPFGQWAVSSGKQGGWRAKWDLSIYPPGSPSCWMSVNGQHSFLRLPKAADPGVWLRMLLFLCPQAQGQWSSPNSPPVTTPTIAF